MDAFIYDGLRTPFGRHGGALSGIRPDDLIATVIERLVKRAGCPSEQIEDVILGCTNQAGEDSRNIARRAGLLAGLPIAAGGITVNRLCASGLAAVADAARVVATGQGDVVIGGGVESMTRAPFAMAKAEKPYQREAKIYDTTIGSRFPNPAFTERFGDHAMPETADEVARELGLTREACDAFALRSQQRWRAGMRDTFFDGELTTIGLPGHTDGIPNALTADEHPRPKTTIEDLGKLKPLNKGGVVTAGNASGINDGACALVIGNGKAEKGMTTGPMARILSAAVAGVEPRVMGLGPVPACRKALERAGLTLKDMDVIEINEAFAAQVLGCLKQLGLAEDDTRLNPNGGAIAMGHPLGASGARLALTATRELRRREGRYALVSLCIGVGQGLAMVLQRAG